jgi:glucokinase
VVGITLGTGVGSGLILDGKIYSGKNGGAGEVGYLNYLDQDFEFYGGSFFFDEKHRTAAREEFEKASHGDKQSLKIWEEYGTHMGNLVKTVLYAYDPDAIVFGGSISKAATFFEASMIATMGKNFHFPNSMKRVKIFWSENENINLLGASSLVK